MRTGPMSFNEIIDEIRADSDILDHFHIYADEDLGFERDLNTPIYVADEPTVDVSGDDLPPEPLRGSGMESLCTVELLHTVIAQAVKKKPHVTNAEIVRAFDHYMENDAFMFFDE